jgi:hypothetical protein
MAKVWAQHWGRRTDDIARHAVLTLAHTPGTTLADLPLPLTDTGHRRRAVRAARARLGPAPGPTLEGFWDSYDTWGAGQQATQAGPLLGPAARGAVPPVRRRAARHRRLNFSAR